MTLTAFHDQLSSLMSQFCEGSLERSRSNIWGSASDHSVLNSSVCRSVEKIPLALGIGGVDILSFVEKGASSSSKSTSTAVPTWRLREEVCLF